MFGRGKRSSSKQRLALAMVLLEREAHLQREALLDAWRSAWPGLKPPADFAGAAEGGDASTMTFEVDRMMGALGMMAARIPGDEVENATSFLWPNSDEELPRVQAHAIVTVTGSRDHLDIYKALTRLVTTVVRSTGALGVYMGSAGKVIKGEVFDELARHYLDHDLLPTLLWIDFRVYASAGRASLVTYGMNEFGLPEIEIHESREQPQALREFAENIADYVLLQGPVMRDGDTVGVSAEQRVRVRHTSSLVDRPGLVYRLEGL